MVTNMGIFRLPQKIKTHTKHRHRLHNDITNRHDYSNKTTNTTSKHRFYIRKKPTRRTYKPCRQRQMVSKLSTPTNYNKQYMFIRTSHTKINKKNSYEAKCKYCFYFKWGGNLPPMSTIEDPKAQCTYTIPGNELKTTSLQNPATAPERLLHQFDQRRGTLTEKAIQRIKQDWDTEKYFITDAATKFNVQLQGETSPETSSEEEEKEDNLFQQLQQQRLKQRNLKQRILKTLMKLQTSE